MENISIYYFVQQNGTNVDVDGDADISWNSNLNKPIKKIFFVEGIIGATSTDTAALEFDSSVTNLDIIITSGAEVLGAGGAGGTSENKIGEDGGNAISFTSTANSININVKSNGNLKSGGGGGGFGGQGNYTQTISQYATFSSNHSTTLNDGGLASCQGATNKPANGDFAGMGMQVNQFAGSR